MTPQSSHRFFQTATRRYALAGVAFGCLFPLVATFVSILEAQLPISLASVVAVQQTQPLLWIIDTAPIFLGLFAAFAGRREDMLRQTTVLQSELSARLREQQEDQERQLIERGILKVPVNLKRNHLSYAHTDAHIDSTLGICEEVLKEMFATPARRSTFSRGAG